MTYHMRDMKHITPARAGESAGQALVACALCATATVLLLAIVICLT